MHTAPADLALGGQTFAMILGYFSGLAKSLGDFFGIAHWIFGPRRHASG